MSGVTRWAIGAAAIALAIGSATSVGAQPPPPSETVELLTDALEALRSGDAAAYDDAAEQLWDDGHWLPSGGWDALEDRSDGDLSFIWLLLDGDELEPLVMALEQVSFEHELLAELQAFGDTDLFLLDLVDTDGQTILEVLDHRKITFSPELRLVLGPLTENVLERAPDLSLYQNVMGMLSLRLGDAGYSLPMIPGLDQYIESAPDSPGPKPGPGGQLPPIGNAADPDQLPTPDPAGELPEPMADATGSAEPAMVPAADGGPDQPPTEPVVEPDGASSDQPAESSPVADSTSDDNAGAATTDATENVAATGDSGSSMLIVALLASAALLAVGAIVFALKRNRQHGELADIAFRDGLTGLHNRRRFDDDLDAESRHGDRPTSVIMIDVDHFKNFNDTYGHAVGDDVLRTVGEVIARVVRNDDLPYRYGGEEFSVLLPDTAAGDAAAVGERIRDAIERAFVWVPGGSQVSVTASLGVSAGTAEHVGDLVHEADRALYRAKENGRNQLVCA